MNDKTTTSQPTTGRAAPRARLTAALGLALLTAGLIAWVWTGEWRWALTGLASLLVTAVFAPAANNREKP